MAYSPGITHALPGAERRSPCGRREFEGYVSGIVTGTIVCALIGGGIGSLSARTNFGGTEGAIAGAVVGLLGGTLLALIGLPLLSTQHLAPSVSG